MALSIFSKRSASIAALMAVTLSLAACGGGTTTTTESPAADGAATSPEASPAASNLSGAILADGSSTVYPVTEAMAEEFGKANPGVKVTVGTSGTGGGFEKFCGGETDISNASRPIKDTEVEKCKAAGIEYVEIPVAVDALTVVVNPQNDWATCLTVDELKKIWEPGAQGKVSSWDQINPKFPKEPLQLYGPGTDSGTFDYFTKEINGEEGASRGDYTASEDDNVLVTGVEGSKGALGYFGYAYFIENEDKLKAVEIDGGKGCVAPNKEDVVNNTYAPLSRPLFIYVTKKALAKPEVKAFIDFYTDAANRGLVEETGYVGLPDDAYAKVKESLK